MQLNPEEVQKLSTSPLYPGSMFELDQKYGGGISRESLQKYLDRMNRVKDDKEAGWTRDERKQVQIIREILAN